LYDYAVPALCNGIPKTVKVRNYLYPDGLAAACYPEQGVEISKMAGLIWLPFRASFVKVGIEEDEF
jgi:hypothetical protein